jgi:hypothetical protein
MRVCMFDRADKKSNELFRFSTTKQQWEQLDKNISGFPPSAQARHGMVSVGSDLYVFGGDTVAGEEGLGYEGHRLGACQIERLGDAPRIVSSCDLRLTRVCACCTVQVSRMSSFASRRRSRSGRSSTRAPRRAGETVTAWCPWGATSTCLEGMEVMKNEAMQSIVWVHARESA